MEKDPLIGLIFATMTEAKPFVQGIVMEKIESTPFSVFEKARAENKPFEKGRIENRPFSVIEKGRIENRPFSVSEKGRILLVISGIGKVNAAMAVFYCCQTFHPALICNLGAAGATVDSFVLGDILHITEAIEYDRHELRSQRPLVHSAHTLEGFPVAKVATQDTPVFDADKREEIASFAELVDMEAASIIQACDKFQTKCVIFKFVSDTPVHTHVDDIITNIKQYRTPFYDFFKNAVMPRLFTEPYGSKALKL